MIKTLLGILGILLFLISAGFGFTLLQSNKQAALLDDQKTSYGMIAEGPLPCVWETSLKEKVTAENKSQAIIIQATNSTDEKCESKISLRAPGFDISPAKEEQDISLAPKAKGSFSWILTPRKTGTFEITVSDVMDTRVLGITVKNMYGLTGPQAQLFSIIGSLFGPMFTIPWWMEKLLARKF